MNSLSMKNFPPKLSPTFDFIQDQSFQQSDYQDEILLNIGTKTFVPTWDTVIPLHQENINCFCPFCGRYVQISQALACQIEGSKGICLGHKLCIQKHENEEIKFQYQKSEYTIEKGSLSTFQTSNGLGQKQYLLSTSINHPLSTYKYLKMEKKMIMSENIFAVHVQNNHESQSNYDPNKIIVPLAQMNINLEMKEIGSQIEGQKFNFNVDLSDIFVGIQITEKHSTWIVTTSNQNGFTLKIQVQLIFDQQMKKLQIEEMNFKYPHPLIKTLPLVKINKIILKSKENKVKILNSGIENTKTSSSYQEFFEGSEGQNSGSVNMAESLQIRIMEPMCFSKEIRVQHESTTKVESILEQSNFKNTDSFKLESSLHLKDILVMSKTQAGSKQLQRKIREMKTMQREALIVQISDNLVELIQNDYANYMVQTLVGCCNSKQRLKVFNSLKNQIIDLICLKQGTFAFQQMICYMDTHQQYALITQLMSENFGKVSMDANGNHFLRKLIPIMPFYYTEIIINSVFDNFLELVNNKNSVCVLKIILHTIAKQNDNEKIQEIRRNFLERLIQNREKVIKNQFGNYFIQEAYETFGQSQLKPVSEYLLMKFKALAKEKFSSSVLCKCICSYWRGTAYYQKLKSKISSGQIVELFKNKQGNKVLLQLMFSEIQNSFKYKVFAAICNLHPSKFNSSKWNSIIGNNFSTRMTNSLPLNLSGSLENSIETKVSPMAKKKLYNIQ